MKAADVVSFILCRNGKILVEQRKHTEREDPGKIVIPAGHVKKGEAFEKACTRELKEELKVDCEKFRFIISLPYRSNVKEMVIHYYECRQWKGIPKCLDAERIFWIGSHGLGVLEEVDQKALREFFKIQACAKPNKG